MAAGVCAAVLALAPLASAHGTRWSHRQAHGTAAARGVHRGSQAPPGLATGFANDPVLTNPVLIGSSGALQNSWMGQAANEGATFIRIPLNWSNVAPEGATPPPGFNPADPASPDYNWTTIDQDVRSIVAHGLQPVIMIYFAPRWAEGPNMPASAAAGSWEPDPQQLALFAGAAAQRYSGHFPDPLNPGSVLPHVTYWQAWNEPNLAYYLSPPWTSSGQPNSPNLYRPMLDDFYQAVKAVDSTNFVLMAGTSPYGDPPTVFWPGGQRMPPLVFDGSLFCVDAASLQGSGCPGPVYLDAIDHHPYEIPPPQKIARQPGDASVPDVWKIIRLLNAGLKAGNVLPNTQKPVWIGELTWDTNPPSQNPIAAPLQDQACYYELAMYLLWRQGVSTVLFLQLRDWVPMPPWQATFRWGGLFFNGGQAKPSATAFKFPLVAHRVSPLFVQVWGMAPAAGLLRIKRQLASGGWIVIHKQMVAPRQVFLTTVPLKGTVTVQASVAGSSSLVWNGPSPVCPGH